VLEGVFQHVSREQAAVFAEGAKQDPVQQLLDVAQNFGRGDGGVLAAEAGEDALADVHVAGVEIERRGASVPAAVPHLRFLGLRWQSAATTPLFGLSILPSPPRNHPFLPAYLLPTAPGPPVWFWKVLRIRRLAICPLSGHIVSYPVTIAPVAAFGTSFKLAGSDRSGPRPPLLVCSRAGMTFLWCESRGGASIGP
jgi:hypothetical protein